MAELNTRCADDAALYEDIDFCMGEKSLPGTRNHGYYVPRRNIKKFPRPAGSAAEKMEDVAVIKSNIELYADKLWKRFALVPNESEPTAAGQLWIEDYAQQNHARHAWYWEKGYWLNQPDEQRRRGVPHSYGRRKMPTLRFSSLSGRDSREPGLW